MTKGSISMAYGQLGLDPCNFIWRNRAPNCGWVAKGNYAGRKVTRNYGPCANNGVRSDGHARKQHGTSADQNVGPQRNATAESGSRSDVRTITQFAFVIDIGLMVYNAGISNISGRSYECL